MVLGGIKGAVISWLQRIERIEFGVRNQDGEGSVSESLLADICTLVRVSDKLKEEEGLLYERKRP